MYCAAGSPSEQVTQQPAAAAHPATDPTTFFCLKLSGEHRSPASRELAAAAHSDPSIMYSAVVPCTVLCSHQLSCRHIVKRELAIVPMLNTSCAAMRSTGRSQGVGGGGILHCRERLLRTMVWSSTCSIPSCPATTSAG